MTDAVTYWAVELVDGSQEFWLHPPSADDVSVVRSAELPRPPHVDGHETWNFDSGAYAIDPAVVRFNASQLAGEGLPWTIHLQHVRKEMLAHLILAGVDLGSNTLVHKEAATMGLEVEALATTILAKASASDELEVERVYLRANPSEIGS